MSSGILYVATGERFVNEARVSARSVHRLDDSITTCIVTDQRNPGTEFDEVQRIPDPERSNLDKLTYLSQTPFEKTIFLDTDTFICRDIRNIFSLLDSFPLAVARTAFYSKEHPFSNQTPIGFDNFNTGVLAYKSKPGVFDFFSDWKQNYLTHPAESPADQPPFKLTLYNSELKYYILSHNYNCPTRYSTVIHGPAYVLHGRHNQDWEYIESEINSSKDIRLIFSTRWGVRCIVVDDISKLLSLMITIRNQGVINSFKQLIQSKI